MDQEIPEAQCLDAQERCERAITDQFSKEVVTQFRRESLIFDLFIGQSSGHSGEDIDEGDLYSLTGKNGLIESLANLLYRRNGCEQLSANLLDDLHDLEEIEDQYHMHPRPGSASKMVKKIIKDFNEALSAYAALEKSLGRKIEDDPESGIDKRIENPLLIQYFLMAQSGDYDRSHCEFHQ